ncbi:MAG: hypothetical protein PHQ00_04890 [Phycisphaerae bacterium]|nr:hypothetical protein [Phycisphaerae bacterium]
MLSGDEIRGNNTMRTPAVFILAGVVGLYAAGSTQAEPTMEIQINKTQGDYWLENPGLENLWQYTITNMSDSGSQNNMIGFILPAGTDQGIFYVGNATGNWTVTDFGTDNILLEGLLTSNPDAPSSFTFDVYFTGDTFHQDYATATAVGPPDGLTFQPELTDVPGEFPRTLEADIYFDGIVNFKDFAMLAEEWMNTIPGYGSPGEGNAQIMDIQVANAQSEDYWQERPGIESLFQYTVTNNTPSQSPGDSLWKYTVPVGSEDGVFWAEAPTNWDIIYGLGETVFETSNAALPANGGQGLFEIYSTNLDVGKLYVTATSFQNGVFNPVEVDAPIKALKADITSNGIVDTNDLKQMSNEWLMMESWYGP